MPTTVGGFTQADIVTAVSAAQAGDGVVLFPEGTYTVQTLDLSSLYDITFRAYRRFNYANGKGVRLKFTGTEGGTLLKLNGESNIFENFFFDLNHADLVTPPYLATGNGAAIGVHLYGAGCALNKFYNCLWHNGEYTTDQDTPGADCVLVKAGTNIGDSQCSDTYFSGCHFLFANTAYRSVNHQAVNIDFLNCNFFKVNTCLDLVAGGRVKVHGGGSSIINCDGVLSVSYGGVNSGSTYIEGKCEPWGLSQRRTWLVRAANTTDILRVEFHNFDYNDGSVSDGNDDKDATLFKLGSKVHLLSKFGHYRNTTVSGSSWPLKTGAGKFVSENDVFQEDVMVNADLGGGRGTLIQDSGEASKFYRPRLMGTNQGLLTPTVTAPDEPDVCRCYLYVKTLAGAPVENVVITFTIQQGDGSGGVGITSTVQTDTTDADGLAFLDIPQGWSFSYRGPKGKTRRARAPIAATLALPELIVQV